MANSLNQDENYGSYLIKMELRWGDQDALRHVNNTVYFRYFEEARIRLFKELGMDMSRGDYFMVLAHASCDFLKPLLYPANIVVGQKLVRIGRSSMELECWIADADDSQILYAQGRNVLVSTDSNTGKSAPWSDYFRKTIVQCFNRCSP